MAPGDVVGTIIDTEDSWKVICANCALDMTVAWTKAKGFVFVCEHCELCSSKVGTPEGPITIKLVGD